MAVTKSSILNIRINNTVKSALKVKAESIGLSVSDYVRLLIMEDMRKTFNVPKSDSSDE